MPAQVLLSPSLIDRMCADEKFLAEFKFLRNPPKKAQASPSCNTCPKSRKLLASAKPERDYHAIKRTIMGLPSVRQVKLRQMLNAKELKVFYRDARNKMHEAYL